MRKSLAFIMTLILCIGLCACGNEDAAHTEYPKDWDRIAEATKTLNRYYACETEDEFRAVIHSSVSDSNFKMIMDNMLSFRQAWVGIDNGIIAEQYVRKIKFIETYKGCDVFVVSDGYESTGGYRTPDDPTPEKKAPVVGSVIFSSMNWTVCALAYENGQYVLANSFGNDWMSYYASITPCTCDLGIVVVPGDPCKSCNGEGHVGEQSSDETHNIVTNNCATCNGSGYVGQGADSIVNINELQPCPDCSLTLGNMFVGADGIVRPNIQTVEPCTDCEGTGLENYTYGDCPLCNGVGYTKSGN